MTAFTCSKGNVIATSDRDGEVVSRHHGRTLKFIPGTVIISCHCCQEPHIIPIPLGLESPITDAGAVTYTQQSPAVSVIGQE